MWKEVFIVNGASTVTAARGSSTLTAEQQALAEVGYAVVPGAVSTSSVETALRLLNLEIARSGITPAEVLDCQQSTFFPHLRWRTEIWDLLPPAAEALLRHAANDEWAESQLLLRFPDEATEWPLEPHVDEPPPWAAGRSYRGILGVALTRSRPEDGCLRVWPGSHLGGQSDPVSVPLEPGDAVVMHPLLGHTGGLNRGSSIRTAVYFRLIAGGGAASG